MSESQAILTELRTVLKTLHAFPYPHVPTPAGCKRRASVAVIIRVRPAYQPALEPTGSLIAIDQTDTPADSIDEFFSKQWVQDGDPEVLFIKRAGRAGDRWSGHVALPGGKRDPEDDDDVAAAIRETREEIGLDLNLSECLRAGNLPERVVSTTWGKEALMVLCPYIFLLTGRAIPTVQPSPAEVAAVHWVPLRALLSPALRTREYVDTASRMAKQGGPVVQAMLRALVGRMMFSAIQLLPSESVYASSIPGFVPSAQSRLFSGLAEGAFGVPSSTQGLAFQQPLLLWGLTLGVLADFLDMLPPYNAVKLWKYPTFTPYDLRAFVYLFTFPLRQNSADALSTGTQSQKPRRRMSQTAMDEKSHAVAVTEAEPLGLANKNEVGISGLGVGSNPKDSIGRLLSGYYDRMNYAIAAFLLYRTAVGSAAVYYLVKLWHRRGSRL